MIDTELLRAILIIAVIIFLIIPPIAVVLSFCSYIGKVWAIRLLFDRRKEQHGDEAETKW